MAFNRKQKLRDNIEAIRTAFILDRENRTATTEERAILQRYCGFGGLKCILNPAKELTDAVRWAKSDLELFAPTVELHRLIRENSKDETEYKRFVDSLKASVLTAFYTPKEITDTLADVLADYSVRPSPYARTVGRCRRVRGFHAAAQPGCGRDGFREGSAHGYNPAASLSRQENAHLRF